MKKHSLTILGIGFKMWSFNFFKLDKMKKLISSIF